MPADDQFVKIGRLLAGEAMQPQIIHDEQVRREERPEDPVHRVVYRCLYHGPEEVVGMDEAHGMSRPYGGIAQGLGEEALAHAGRR